MYYKYDSRSQGYFNLLFTHYFNFRTDMRGGGVSIFVNNKLKHSQIEGICENNNHYLWVHIESHTLDICAVYRKPESSNINPFLETYSKQLLQRERAVIFGDFNFNLLVPDRGTNTYKELIQESGYEILNKIDEEHCTRLSTTTKSILDHICSNLKQDEFHVAVIDTPMSDHKQIYFEVKRYQPKTLKKVNYQAVDYKKLYKFISESQNNMKNTPIIPWKKN